MLLFKYLIILLLIMYKNILNAFKANLKFKVNLVRENGKL